MIDIFFVLQKKCEMRPMKKLKVTTTNVRDRRDKHKQRNDGSCDSPVELWQCCAHIKQLQREC